MNTTTQILAAGALAVSMLAASPTADARTNARMQDACEQAVRDELGDGHTRINRVSTVESDGTARFWLTVRHKTDTAPKSDRYRVLCSVDFDDAEPAIEVESGWWQKARRGQTPLAVD